MPPRFISQFDGFEMDLSDGHLLHPLANTQKSLQEEADAATARSVNPGDDMPTAMGLERDSPTVEQLEQKQSQAATRYTV